jgi:hypothetical protein
MENTQSQEMNSFVNGIAEAKIQHRENTPETIVDFSTLHSEKCSFGFDTASTKTVKSPSIRTNKFIHSSERSEQPKEFVGKKDDTVSVPVPIDNSSVCNEEEYNKNKTTNENEVYEAQRNNIIDAMNDSLEKNSQNLTTSELVFCKTFFLSISKIYDDIHDILDALNLTKETFTVEHIDIPKIVLCISNIVKRHSTTEIKEQTKKPFLQRLSKFSSQTFIYSSERSKDEKDFSGELPKGVVEKPRSNNSVSVTPLDCSPENLISLIKFIVTTLIEYNIIMVPEEMKPTVDIIVKYSMELLEMKMDLTVMQEIMDKEKKCLYKCLSKYVSCFCKGSS